MTERVEGRRRGAKHSVCIVAYNFNFGGNILHSNKVATWRITTGRFLGT